MVIFRNFFNESDDIYERLIERTARIINIYISSENYKKKQNNYTKTITRINVKGGASGEPWVPGLPVIFLHGDLRSGFFLFRVGGIISFIFIIGTNTFRNLPEFFGS